MSKELTTSGKNELSEVMQGSKTALAVMSSFKMTPKETVNLLTKARSLSKVREVSEDGVLIIDVIGMSVEAVKLTTDDGEVVDGLAGIFIDKEKQGYYTQSMPLMRNVAHLIAAYGEPRSWKEPIKIKFSKQSYGSRTVNTLEVV